MRSAILLILGVGLLSCGNTQTQTPDRSLGMDAINQQGDGLYAIMKTNRGDIVLRLEYEKAPMTVANFVGLAEGTLEPLVRRGQPYYDGLTFHRVVQDFVIQGGDPQGTGRGGPGYKFPDEITDLKHDSAGILSMANAGPDTNGSQFFITHRATPHLDGKHTVFGRVIHGLDVVDAIQQGDTITSLTIIRKGEKAEAFRPNQAMFDRLVQEASQRRQEQSERRKQEDLAAVSRRWPDARVTSSGLRYLVRSSGRGPTPTRGQNISVHYEGRLLNDQVFDSSYRRNEPIQFSVGTGRVIPGWDEGLLGMRVGEKRTLIIPPNLGYGAEGAGGVIPPDAWLIFDVELVSINP